MRDVYIYSAVRTPIGLLGGALKDIEPQALMRVALDGAMDASGIAKEEIGEVICGQTKQSTDAPNVARVAALLAGIPEAVPAYTVHRQCASGMQAIWNGVQAIRCGDSDVVLAGGVESMSTAPFYMRGARFGMGSGNAQLLDPNVESQPKSQPAGLYGTFNMVETADTVAALHHITREEQDAYALESQRRAVAAIDAGRFADEIVPVAIPKRKGEPVIFAQDEFPRRDTSLEKLAKLKPLFPAGTVTAGTASGRNDGAAALVLGGKRASGTPLARILDVAAVGVDPKTMGMGPVAATQKLLQKLAPLGLALSDFGLFELNEAFAAQVLACMRELGLDHALTNVNGGGISLGHPLGCSGARIVVTLLHEMKRRGIKRGMASICVAGGLGMALALELV